REPDALDRAAHHVRQARAALRRPDGPAPPRAAPHRRPGRRPPDSGGSRMTSNDAQRRGAAPSARVGSRRGADEGGAKQGAQMEMVHTLPEARVVNRIEYVTGLARGKRVIHVGFVDASYEDMQAATGTWLHEHLGSVASSLVGVD